MLALLVYLRLRYGPYLGYKLTPIQKFRWQISLFGFALVASSIALYVQPTTLHWVTSLCFAATMVLSIVQFTRNGRTL